MRVMMAFQARTQITTVICCELLAEAASSDAVLQAVAVQPNWSWTQACEVCCNRLQHSLLLNRSNVKKHFGDFVRLCLTTAIVAILPFAV